MALYGNIPSNDGGQNKKRHRIATGNASDPNLWIRAMSYAAGGGGGSGGLVGTPGDHGSPGDAPDDPDPDFFDEPFVPPLPLDMFDWCCVPLMIPAFDAGYWLVWVCIPFAPGSVDHPLCSKTLEECKAHCPPAPPVRVPPPVVGGPADPIPEDDPIPPHVSPVAVEDPPFVTFYCCCVHWYEWVGQMNFDFFHFLPPMETLVEIKNSASITSPPHLPPYDQAFYGRLLPRSGGIGVNGRAFEEIRKIPMLRAVITSDNSEYPMLGGIIPDADCQEERRFVRKMRTNCDPLMPAIDQSAHWGGPVFNSKFEFVFWNAYCSTVQGLEHNSSLDCQDPIFEGPMGGEPISEDTGYSGPHGNNIRCGGSLCQCWSREMYEMIILANPFNWDLIDPNSPFGGPNGFGPPQMIKEVPAQKMAHCGDCCTNDGTFPAPVPLAGMTTGSYNLAAFLAFFLIKTGISANPQDPNSFLPNSGNDPEFEGACCREPILEAWDYYMEKHVTNEWGSGQWWPDFQKCGSSPGNDATTGPDQGWDFRPHPYVLTIGTDPAPFNDQGVMYHQGHCTFADPKPSCHQGSTGSSFITWGPGGF